MSCSVKFLEPTFSVSPKDGPEDIADRNHATTARLTVRRMQSPPLDLYNQPNALLKRPEPGAQHPVLQSSTLGAWSKTERYMHGAPFTAGRHCEAAAFEYFEHWHILGQHFGN